MIPVELFSFAYIPSWFEQLHELSLLAAPESWRFIAPQYEMQNKETPILERYINRIFKSQAVGYNYAAPAEADSFFYIRNQFACFHTGLYTPSLKPIYMCFDRNKYDKRTKTWCFKGFADENSAWLRYVQPLPQSLVSLLRGQMMYFDPNCEIRINTEHILGDEENVARLPEAIRSTWNLPLLLQTAVEMSRRKAQMDLDAAAVQVFHSQVQYLLPIYMTRMDQPDMAMALTKMDGYYLGHTCLTLEMAYVNARLLARPSAGWLTALVEPERSHDV